jgi:NAD+ kinase
MNPPVTKIGLILKPQDVRVPALAAEIVPWLQARGAEVFLDADSALQCPGLIDTATVVSADALASHVNVVTVFGGDGTFLHAARIVGLSGVPILGVNLGSLGFLTEVKVEEMYFALADLLAGKYGLEDRMLLEAEVLRAGNTLHRYLSLNEVAINKGALSRIMGLEVTVNDQLMTFTRADGLIISTPTGSTAYSLSAGGPVLYPTLGAFVITPICPHTLTNRPVVIPDLATVRVCLRHGYDVMLTVDGQVGMPLLENDFLKIRKASKTIRLIQAVGGPFFKLLREKLKWE